MNKNIIIAILLALVVILAIVQLAPSLLGIGQADLTDIDAVHRYVQSEITDVSRDEFAAWDRYYLDVTNDGIDELIVAEPHGGTGHPYMEIIQVDGRRLQRIPAEIPVANQGSIPEVRDGFLTVTSTTNDAGGLHTYMDIYLYDGSMLLPSLLTVTLFRSEPMADEITGELDGPLTDFTQTLMNIDPLRSNPVVRKGVYRHRFEPATKSFASEQLQAAEATPLGILNYAALHGLYSYDLDGSGAVDTFLLEIDGEPRLAVNDEVFPLTGVHGPSLEQQYRLAPLEYEAGYAFVFYTAPSNGEPAAMHFYQYTGTAGLSHLGVVRTAHSLFRAPILALYRDRVAVDYTVYSFTGDRWHVSDDEEWLAEYTDLNIGGRFNLQGLTNEPFGDHWVPYDQYVAVIIPMYDGVNLGQLTAKEFAFNEQSGPRLSFAVFGTMHNTEITYIESYFSDDDPIVKEIGTIEDAMVTVHAALPWDTSFVRVSGMVYGGEGWENQVEFTLDDMRCLAEYEPIFVVY